MVEILILLYALIAACVLGFAGGGGGRYWPPPEDSAENEPKVGGTK